jgi:hypothetical protein
MPWYLIDRLNVGLAFAFFLSISFLQFVRGPFERTYPHLHWLSGSTPNLVSAVVIPFIWTSFDEPGGWRAHVWRCVRSAGFLVAYECAQLSAWTPGQRRFDVNDLVATMLGTGAALALGRLYSRRSDEL